MASLAVPQSEAILPPSGGDPIAAAVPPQEQQQQLRSTPLIVPTFGPTDVILGKGNGINYLPGNCLFRKIVDRYRPQYVAAVRRKKAFVATDVAQEMAQLQPPARFLIQVYVDGDNDSSSNNESSKKKKKSSSETEEGTNTNKRVAYMEVSAKRQREKICQALREKKIPKASNSSSNSSSSMANGEKKKKSRRPKKQRKVPVVGVTPMELHSKNGGDANAAQTTAASQTRTTPTPRQTSLSSSSSTTSRIRDSTNSTNSTQPYPPELLHEASPTTSTTTTTKPNSRKKSLPMRTAEPSKKRRKTTTVASTQQQQPRLSLDLTLPATPTQEESSLSSSLVDSAGGVLKGLRGDFNTNNHINDNQTGKAEDNHSKSNNDMMPCDAQVGTIHANDVLFGGRGRRHFHRPANRRYMEQMKKYSTAYQASTAKRLFARNLYEQWETDDLISSSSSGEAPTLTNHNGAPANHRNGEPPLGRFLQQDVTGVWHVMPKTLVLDKMCQSFRDINNRQPQHGGSDTTTTTKPEHIHHHHVPVETPPTEGRAMRLLPANLESVSPPELQRAASIVLAAAKSISAGFPERSCSGEISAANHSCSRSIAVNNHHHHQHQPTDSSPVADAAAVADSSSPYSPAAIPVTPTGGASTVTLSSDVETAAILTMMGNMGGMRKSPPTL